MKRVFVDTSFYQALLNPKDAWHSAALEFSSKYRGEMLTTEYVLFELGALMARGLLRQLFVDLVGSLRSDPRTQILAASSEAFDEGLRLFRERLDKDWSLTDCVSFALASPSR